jgi:hypothetical protein
MNAPALSAVRLTHASSAPSTPSAPDSPAGACEPSALRQPAVLARSTARLLDACATAAGSTGLLCAAAAAVALVMRAPLSVATPLAQVLALALVLVLALLPLERLLWLRLRFDAGLFADLALELDRADAAASAGATLDAALHALRLRGPAGEPRPLADRALGARRLAQRHALVALVQCALLVSALALGLWPRI